jgi:hypothetical protein
MRLLTLAELSTLIPGTLAINETEAKQIQLGAHIVNGKYATGEYEAHGPYDHVYALVDVIGEVLVNGRKPEIVFQAVIPKFVEFFRVRFLWRIDSPTCQSAIRPRIDVWIGKAGLKGLERNDPTKKLSKESQDRIRDAHRRREWLQLDAMAKIDSQGIDQDSRRGTQIANKADLEGARLVLKVTAEEFAATGMDSQEFRKVMREDIEAASISLHLFDSQKRLLENELCELPDSVPLTQSEVPQTPDEALTKEQKLAKSSAVFPQRAAWLSARLQERGWDHNNLENARGPDHKSTQKLLRGEKVTPKVLRKTVSGLNFHAQAPKVTFKDIPNA